jgi:hypothetical protein
VYETTSDAAATGKAKNRVSSSSPNKTRISFDNDKLKLQQSKTVQEALNKKKEYLSVVERARETTPEKDSISKWLLQKTTTEQPGERIDSNLRTNVRDRETCISGNPR